MVNRNNPKLNEIFNRAETLKKIGEYSKAVDVYEKITAMYPEDYRGWLNLIPFTVGEKRIRNIQNVEKLCDGDVKKELYRIMVYSFERKIDFNIGLSRKEWHYYEKYCGEYLNTCTESVDDFMKEYPEIVIKAALLNTRMRNFTPKEFILKHCTAVRLRYEKESLYLPCIINNHLFWDVTEDVIWSDGYDLSEYISCKYIYNIPLNVIRKKALEWLEIYKRKKEGLCLYCGGKISLFTGKCKKCGKKDRCNGYL